MFPEGSPDSEYPHDANQTGVRKDKRNLVQEWQAKHQVMGAHGCRVQQGRAWGVRLWAEAWFCPSQGAQYVWNRTALLQAASDSSVTHLMGNDSTHNHCPPHDGRHGPPVPSLQVSAGPLSHRPL